MEKFTPEAIKRVKDRIRQIEDTLDKRLGESKSFADWDGRIKILEKEKNEIERYGGDVSYYAVKIFDARKKRAESMDDGSLDEQLKKIEAFIALRDEEEQELQKKIDKEQDPKRKEKLADEKVKKLAYYEKKISEVEGKIEPKSEEEHQTKIDRIRARRIATIAAGGLTATGNIRADVTYLDSQIVKAQRELDKLSTAKAERPIQFSLEDKLKGLQTERDKKIANKTYNAIIDRALDEKVGLILKQIPLWRALFSQKAKTLGRWQERKQKLEEARAAGEELWNENDRATIQTLIDEAVAEAEKAGGGKQKAPQQNPQRTFTEGEGI